MATKPTFGTYNPFARVFPERWGVDDKAATAAKYGIEALTGYARTFTQPFRAAAAIQGTPLVTPGGRKEQTVATSDAPQLPSGINDTGRFDYYNNPSPSLPPSPAAPLVSSNPARDEANQNALDAMLRMRDFQNMSPQFQDSVRSAGGNFDGLNMPVAGAGNITNPQVPAFPSNANFNLGSAGPSITSGDLPPRPDTSLPNTILDGQRIQTPYGAVYATKEQAGRGNVQALGSVAPQSARLANIGSEAQRAARLTAMREKGRAIGQQQFNTMKAFGDSRAVGSGYTASASGRFGQPLKGLFPKSQRAIAAGNAPQPNQSIQQFTDSYPTFPDRKPTAFGGGGQSFFKAQTYPDIVNRNNQWDITGYGGESADDQFFGVNSLFTQLQKYGITGQDLIETRLATGR